MATKRKLEDESTTDHLIGYLTNVSPVRTSASGTTKYFTGKFQTSKTETRRLISFSPEKHAEFVRNSQQTSPVRLMNATQQIGRNGEMEITVNRNSKMDICTRKLDFKRQSCSDVKKNLSEYKLAALVTENMLVRTVLRYMYLHI